MTDLFLYIFYYDPSILKIWARCYFWKLFCTMTLSFMVHVAHLFFETLMRQNVIKSVLHDRKTMPMDISSVCKSLQVVGLKIILLCKKKRHSIPGRTNCSHAGRLTDKFCSMMRYLWMQRLAALYLTLFLLLGWMTEQFLTSTCAVRTMKTTLWIHQPCCFKV